MFNFNSKIRFYNYKKFISKKEILGMTSPMELAFLQYYASKKYTGYGEIVDLGCWLGASTLSLAKGLVLNSKVNDKYKRIHAFDLFYWESSLDHHAERTPLKGKFKPGDNYKWLFLEYTKQYEQQIETRGNILSEEWIRKPIEFLFVDAMKNLETTYKILKGFYPFLIPGKSFLVYQDFDHYLTPWIHLLIYKFRNYFVHIHDIPLFGSTIFKLIKKLPDELINTDVTLIDENDADSAYNYCMKLACPEKRPNIAAAHVMYYYYHEKTEHAKQLWNYYLKKGFNPDSDLKFVKQLLVD